MEMEKKPMSDSLYLDEIETLLETLASIASVSDDPDFIEAERVWTIKTLMSRYGLNLDDAESSVAVAMGGKP